MATWSFFRWRQKLLCSLFGHQLFHHVKREEWDLYEVDYHCVRCGVVETVTWYRGKYRERRSDSDQSD